LGFSPNHEIETYGDRIINVHLKDRSKSGPSVQFGTGNTDFDSYIRGLLEIEYKGNLILQSVRSPSNSHMTELIHSQKFVLDKLEMWAVSE
jgi:L-ribulose-5-phosphate 3-epimerase